MGRRLFRTTVTGFCVLCLPLCAAAGWLWGRSYRVADGVRFARADVAARRLDLWNVGADSGTLAGSVVTLGSDAPVSWREMADACAGAGYPITGFATSANPPAAGGYGDDSFCGRRGFARVCEQVPMPHGDATYRLRLVQIPCWCAMAATALPPVLWLGARGRRVWVRHRRRRRGRCPACGYDLRGSPPGGRCSECGADATSTTGGAA